MPAQPRSDQAVASFHGDLPAQFGPYQIVKRLGKGGMGSVYLAVDNRLNRRVALKVCHLVNHPQAMERFKREAQAAAGLRHPNLCTVHEFDAIDGVTYFTMAFIEGPTHDQWVVRRGGLTQREAAMLVGKLALALQNAHDHGVTHRDLKPTNVAIDGREPIVIDFGLARYQEAGDHKLTREGTVLGTPSYMAPEQVAGDVTAMGPACDIYALGVIFFELLTGRVPFEGPVTAVLSNILVAPPPAPRTLRPQIDAKLEAICLKALAKKPADRWPSMKSFAAALLAWVKATPAPASTDAASKAVPAGDISEAARPTTPPTLATGAAQHVSPPPYGKAMAPDQEPTAQMTASGKKLVLSLLIAAALLGMLIAGLVMFPLSTRRDKTNPENQRPNNNRVLVPGVRDVSLTGQWVGVTRHSFSFKAALTANGSQINGQITWQLLATPPNSHLAKKVGDIGVEDVTGILGESEISLSGTRVSPPGLLSTDNYLIKFDAKAGTFQMWSRTGDGRSGSGSGSVVIAQK